MENEKLYSAEDVCKKLNITIYTLTNWYRWERKLVNEGVVEQSRLPEPERCLNMKGAPRRWTEDMIKQLKTFQKGIVTGRNGIYGAYSNPYHTETKKYKKSLQNE